MATGDTPGQRLATLLLGQSVAAWIAAQRARGHSWRRVAADLKIATNGQVDVRHETIRSWADDVAA